MSFFQLKPLSLAVSSVLLTTVPMAQAQDSGGSNSMEEVFVVASPIRESQMAGIEAKRKADNFVDIISADTIGRFPDQNLADSLGRLPGMAIERDQGQARYINFRGAPFRYTAIAFDGIDVPGAENGRIPRFDSIPSVITSAVEANKAILPSMPGESVSGFINIKTFDPFRKPGLGMALDIGTGEQDLGGGDVSKLAGRFSWSNDNLGAVMYASENSREQITDNREYDLEMNAGQLLVNELDYRSYKIKREDKAHGGRLEYRGEETLRRMFVSTLYSEFVDNEQRNQFVFGLEGAAGVTGENIPVSISRLLEYGAYTNSTETSTLGADFMLGEWDVAARYNITETEFDMNIPIARSLGAGSLANYDLSDMEDPILNLLSGLSDTEYAMTIGIRYIQNLQVESDKFKLDAKHEFSWFDHAATLELGTQWDSRTAEGFVATPVVGGFPVEDIDQYNTGVMWDSNTTNSIGGTYYDNISLRQAWNASGALDNPAIGEENLVAIDEDILALYAMATTEFDWGNVIAGVRVEQTDYTSSGTLEDTPLSVDDQFTHALPSVHVNVNLSSDVKWRLSYSTGVNRPTYNEWRAAASVNVADQEVSGGNPYLEAEETQGFDTALEWYFADASLLSVGAFYRNIDNVIYADTKTVDGGDYLPSAAGENWIYSGTVNGKNGSLNGFEFNFVGQATDLLPSPLDGLGISGNLTLLDSEFEGLNGEKYNLPGTSDMIYNASLFYEKYGFSARVNYQYRDEWISPIESPDEVWDEQARVDLSLSYALPLNLNGITASIYANANNLSNETDVRFDGSGLINQSESYGKYYLVGLRVNY